MRVFVTGATGFVGTAIVRELVGAGHQVTGLARSESSMHALREAGAQAHAGDLEDLDSLRAGAAQADGVIHAGFVHDFARFKACCEIDERAIAALGEALEGSDRPLIVTDGLAFVAPGRVATENMPIPGDAASPRKSEEAGLAFLSRGVRVAVVRLPPSVHGVGDHAFVPMLIGFARAKGVAAYIGDGANRWPAVHRLDAARLYRLALEKGEAGVRYHAIGDEGVKLRDIAAIIGRRLNLPVAGKTGKDAEDYFTWFSMFAGIDAPATAIKTQDALGWRTEQPGLLADIDQEAYFQV